MTDPEMPIHGHDNTEECVQALGVVHASLHGELSEIGADRVRYHLHACERCMESFETEYTVTGMIRRGQPITATLAELCNKLTALCLFP